ncbi:hypothetical protein CPB83DRAFT_905603 [Crepidotus variabilis]|uniref:SET domain-containing protein n=1 Tax=Crepidotus variabilis TaxID=179855 RepID=A0A9P6EI09_9AGAR|nr:hypothetical protein CPB83DRAFT_905603 [Crepidotus variabilis]
MSSRSWSCSISSKGEKVWKTTLPPDYERSYTFQTLCLPGLPSSAHGGLGWDGSTPISCLVNKSHLDALLAALPPTFCVIPQALSPIREEDQLHEVRKTKIKGEGLFATRSIEEGQLILWEHPAIILPSTDREFNKEIYEDLGKAVASASDKELNTRWLRRQAEATKMANEYEGDGGCDTWIEGVVRTNAIVLDLIEGPKMQQSKKKPPQHDKDGQKEIYGGIYPLINRANHSCAPNASVKWDRSTLSASLYALRDIEEGEEIFKTYVNPLLPRAIRLKTLNKNYKFLCDCAHCNLEGKLAVSSNEVALVAESDANRELLATWIFTQPTYKKWSTDLCRADNLFIKSHMDALALIEKEGVYALQAIFIEELAMAHAMLGDLEGFKKWGERVRKLNRVEDPELSRRFQDWLVYPEKRVRRWGWRKRMKEESNGRNAKGIGDVDIGLIFEPIDSESEED